MYNVLLAFCKLASTLGVVQHDLGAQGLLEKIMKASIVLPLEVQKASNSNPYFNYVRHRNSDIRAHSVHTQLKDDLIEHIWQCFGHRAPQ